MKYLKIEVMDLTTFVSFPFNFIIYSAVTFFCQQGIYFKDAMYDFSLHYRKLHTTYSFNH